MTKEEIVHEKSNRSTHPSEWQKQRRDHPWKIFSPLPTGFGRNGRRVRHVIYDEEDDQILPSLLGAAKGSVYTKWQREARMDNYSTKEE
jgi:hypothetical protein